VRQPNFLVWQTSPLAHLTGLSTGY